MQGFQWLFCMLLWGLRVTMIPIFCSGLSSLSHETEERVHRQRWAKAILLQKISLLQGGVPNGLLQKFLCLGVTCALKLSIDWSENFGSATSIHFHLQDSHSLSLPCVSSPWPGSFVFVIFQAKRCEMNWILLKPAGFSCISFLHFSSCSP